MCVVPLLGDNPTSLPNNDSILTQAALTMMREDSAASTAYGVVYNHTYATRSPPPSLQLGHVQA